MAVKKPAQRDGAEPLKFSGKRLAAVRLRLGWKRERLAVGADVSHGSISMWERGKCQPSADRVGAMCTALGCSPSDLFTPGGR